MLLVLVMCAMLLSHIFIKGMQLRETVVNGFKILRTTISKWTELLFSSIQFSRYQTQLVEQCDNCGIQFKWVNTYLISAGFEYI